MNTDQNNSASPALVKEFTLPSCVDARLGPSNPKILLREMVTLTL